MKVDMSGPAIESRVRAANELADLRPEHRLDAELDMSGEGIAARIEAASQMLALCLELGRVGRGEG